ncbi:MAG: type II toxin-antitoxin system RelE/ParE family toxin [Candidatus Latescibacterota bacterium]
MPGIRGPVFKIRVPSRDMQRGTRGGYRVVYYARLREDLVFLLTIYAKSQREDIRPDEINSLLAQIE